MKWYFFAYEITNGKLNIRRTVSISLQIEAPLTTNKLAAVRQYLAQRPEILKICPDPMIVITFFREIEADSE